MPRAASRLGGPPILPLSEGSGQEYKGRRPVEEKKRCERVNEQPGDEDGRGDVKRAHGREAKSTSTHGTAGDSTSCVTCVSRSHAPRPLATGDETSTSAPHPEPQLTGHPFGDEPAALNGRDRGYE